MLSGNGVYIVIALAIDPNNKQLFREVFDELSEIVTEICLFFSMILYFETLYLGLKANLNQIFVVIPLADAGFKIIAYKLYLMDQVQRPQELGSKLKKSLGIILYQDFSFYTDYNLTNICLGYAIIV